MLQNLIKYETYRKEFSNIIQICKEIEEDTKMLNDGYRTTYIRIELTDDQKNTLSEQIKRNKFCLIFELDEIRDKCTERHHYSVFSSCTQFTNNYDYQLDTFLENNYDSIEKDYIDIQMNIYMKLPKESVFLNEYIKYSSKRKIEFLEEKADSLKEVEEDKRKKPFSNFKTVFLLEDLGILKYLSELPLTQEKIAEVIGMINGRHPKNINDFISTIPRRNNVHKLGHKHKSEAQSIINFIDRL